MSGPQRLIFSFAAALLFVLCSNSSYGQRRPVTAPSASAPSIVLSDKVATHTEWSFLPLGATHADAFVREHPTYDGRGVIVFIFDTGVDPRIAGLETTTEGNRKIIDVHDFSGTGDVDYEPAERQGDELRVQGKLVLRGLNAITIKPIDGKYYYGALDEQRFQNGLRDLNFNESDTDIFGVLVLQDAPNHYIAYVDSDGDHDLSNEHPVTNYHEHYDTFAFHSGDSTISSGRRLTGAVNIFPERHLINLYFDDGSHGTHVAGIAAGYNIDNQKGFNGVAPGAEIIACKFADNNAGGVTVSGSMMEAFELAAETAQSQSKPVVVNMSFGIGNELEGHAVMDKWLDSLLEATPNLTVCVSAGNEGPGLSSVGLPGSADRVITSGAALPDNAARDLYNIYASHPVIFDFSSRGGELAKPDIVSPGTAVSTVPDYVAADRYNGTSMSSPYTTGCTALLLSAMTQAFPEWKVNAFEIKRALQLSATHIEGATPLDEGYGMINVPAAFDLLSKWERKGYTPIPVAVEAPVPTLARTGTAAYFRAGNYPTDGGREIFTVQPEERSVATARERAIGMEAFELVSDEPWMSPLQSSIYRRGSGTMNVDVRYNQKLLQKPGMYVGRIWAYEKGTPHTKSESRFELLNTVIIPYQFNNYNEYRVELKDQKVGAGTLQREFFAIPPGTKGVRLTLSTREARGSCMVSLFDNNGEELSGLGVRGNAPNKTSSIYITGKQLTPGIWEADLSRTKASEDEGDMSVDFAVDVQPLEFNNISAIMDNRGRPSVRLQIANPTEQFYSAQSSATANGYERVIDTVITESDEFLLPFSSRNGERGVLFDISMPAEDFNLFTDITCQVLKPDSSAVFNSALDYRTKSVPVSFDESGSQDTSQQSDPSYTLLLQGALALPNRPHRWHLHIVEHRYLQQQQYLSSSPTLLSLPPFQSEELVLNSDQTAPAIPSGYRLFGTIELKKSDQETIDFPIVW